MDKWRFPRDEAQLRQLIDSCPRECTPLLYNALLGHVFSSIAVLERSALLLLAMSRNNRSWEEFPNLRKLTFGKLVSEIAVSGANSRSTTYLKKLNELRNYIIHNFFWDAPFPGELNEHAYALSDVFEFLERSFRHFRVAEQLLLKLFIESGLLSYVDDTKMLISRNDFWDRVDQQA